MGSAGRPSRPSRLPRKSKWQHRRIIPVWITEGEKDVETLESLGFTATTCPMGAGKWHLVCQNGKPPEVLHGKIIIICGDKDEPDAKTGRLNGQSHVEQIAQNLHGYVMSIKVIEAPQGKDVSDYVEAVGIEEAKAKLLELVAARSEYEPSTEREEEPRAAKESPPNKFKKLLATFEEMESTVFLDQYGAAWACMKINDHQENLRLKSAAFKGHLLKCYVADHDEGVGRETMTQVTDLLAARAEEKRSLFNRFAWVNRKLYIDLGTPDWVCIEIDAEGYRKIQLGVPLFRRYPHQQPLPEPECGGHVQDVLKFLALKDEAVQILLLVWLCTAPLEHIPRPGIVFHGLQGSTKSTAQEIMRSLIDPSSTPLLSLPKDSGEFVQLMNHHAVVSIENIGRLPIWASDDLCRAVTGAGFLKRMLFSDDDDVIYSFQRTFLMNGINVPGTRPDLLDRTILIELPRLAPEERLTKEELQRGLEQARPRIFGAMLEVISKAMRTRPPIKLTGLPRMADWCKWGCAISEALGIDHQRFLSAYHRNVGYQHEEVINAEPLCQALLHFLGDKTQWCGEPAELFTNLKEIGEQMDLTKEGWPKATHTMSRKLNSLAHNLAEVGIKVNISKGTRRIITISKESSERIPENASLPSKRLETAQQDDSEQDPSGTLPENNENTVGDDPTLSDFPVNSVGNTVGSNGPDSQDKGRYDASDAFSGSLSAFHPDSCESCGDLFMGWCQTAVEKLSDMRKCPKHTGRRNETETRTGR
jgi:hypothetical protein